MTTRARVLGAQLAIGLGLAAVLPGGAAAQPPPAAVRPPAASTPSPAASTPSPAPAEPTPSEAGPPSPTAAAAPATAASEQSPEAAASDPPGSDAAAAVDPAADDDVLAELGLDPSATVPANDQLMIYGFADVGYHVSLTPYGDVISNVLPKENHFGVGNLNVYLTKKLAEQWRILAEVHFTYAPNGTIEPDGTISQTRGTDPTDFGRDVSWGGIEIERVYIDYEAHPNLTVQVGSFLTPYGIWNVDHGSPTIIATSRPYVIGDQLLPERQTGLHLYGVKALAEYSLGYHATLSNGRGPYEAFRDLDNNKGVGGRLWFEAPWAGTLRIGSSAYTGRFSDRESDVIVVEDGMPVNSTPAGIAYNEVGYAADVLWTRGGLHAQAEVIGRRIAYVDGARDSSGGGAGFAPDSTTFGIYGFVGYRLDRLWNVMPYVMAEHYEPPTNAFVDKADAISAGLNFRPTPSVVLKVQYVDAHLQGPQIAGHIRALDSQIACLF
jgi:hypothetical protein